MSAAAQSAPPIQAKFPPKLAFLLEPATIDGRGRFKVMEGGRGAGKSENAAQALLILGYREPCLILCTREVQRSIRDSVHATLKNWIIQLGMEDFYTVTEHAIRGANGTQFIFAGLANIDSLKSIARVRYCWVEEGQTVSKRSWDKLEPSIRWEDKERNLTSEIWVTYNPELDTDETYRRFHINPSKRAIVVQVNYWDNPWFPETLRADMEELYLKAYEDYLHVWEGQTKQVVEGAIFGPDVIKAGQENRICHVPYNRARPVDTVLDLGQDMMAVWFIQSYDGMHNFIDYFQQQRIEITDVLMEMQRRGYIYRKDYVPYDGIDAIIHKKSVGILNKGISIKNVMKNSGRNVEIVDKVSIETRLNAARLVLPLCRFDREKCSDGLQALRHYRWGPYNKSGERRREPLHDQYSHGSEAFTRFGQIAPYLLRPGKPKIVPKKKRKPIMPMNPNPNGSYAPFG